MGEEIADSSSTEAFAGSLAVTRASLWPRLFLAVLLLLGVAGIVWPMVGGCGCHRHEIRRVIMHAKVMYPVFQRFRECYGQYPCRGTIEEVLKNVPDSGALLDGGSANRYFRQLVFVGLVDQEAPFFVAGAMDRHPDNQIDGGKALEPGECGFAYVVWEDSRQLPPTAPLLLAPVRPGHEVFDVDLLKRAYGRKVVILHIDGTVSLHPIDDDGRVVMANGKDFFDWTLPHWAGQRPEIAWPE